MNLKGLVHRELGEGITEEELASAVKIPVRIVVDILSGRLPQDPAVWEAFARYFHIEATSCDPVVNHTQKEYSNWQRAALSSSGLGLDSPNGHPERTTSCRAR